MDKKQARDSRNKTEIQTRLSMDVEAQKTWWHARDQHYTPEKDILFHNGVFEHMPNITKIAISVGSYIIFITVFTTKTWQVHNQ